MSKATITSKGQMTIPAQVRAALGLEAGDQLLIQAHDGSFSARVVKKTRPAELRGLFAGPPLPDKEERRTTIGRERGMALGQP